MSTPATIGRSESGEVTIDVQSLVGSHMGIVANSGGGKSGLLRKDLAEEVGLSPTASTLGVYISESSKLGFVETRPGEVRLAEWMMP